MKCETHTEEATAICIHCGRAVCSTCRLITSSQRIACSNACTTRLEKIDRILDQSIARSAKTAMTLAPLCYLMGSLLLAFGIYESWANPYLAPANLLSIIMGSALVLFGIRAHRLARKGQSC